MCLRAPRSSSSPSWCSPPSPSMSVGWYTEASRVQRAADSAALAAVVHMPDLVAAQAAAADADVTVLATANGDRGIRVDVTATAEVFFGKIVLSDDRIGITRFSTADYVLAVPMGNPTSSIGTADLDLQGTNSPANYWLNAHADLFSVNAGDLLNSNTHSNPFYTPRGYVYVISKPAGVQVEIQIMHSGKCKRPTSPSPATWPNNRGEQHSTPMLSHYARSIRSTGWRCTSVRTGRMWRRPCPRPSSTSPKSIQFMRAK
jgi:hypothetical protein